jgi:hypothetical protein
MFAIHEVYRYAQSAKIKLAKNAAIETMTL